VAGGTTSTLSISPLPPTTRRFRATIAGSVANLSNANCRVVSTNINSTCLVLLPVTWANVSAIRYGTYSKISWGVSDQKNNKLFVIERSRNGVNFENIGTVAGDGNYANMREYFYTDNKPFGGVNYYRIRQEDFDGNSSYSKIVSVFYENTVKAPEVYPNPSETGRFTVDLNGNNLVKYAVSNILGQQIQEGTWENQTQTSLDLSNFAKGMYLLRMFTESGQTQYYWLSK
jgi:hypothetical protein